MKEEEQKKENCLKEEADRSGERVWWSKEEKIRRKVRNGLERWRFRGFTARRKDPRVFNAIFVSDTEIKESRD